MSDPLFGQALVGKFGFTDVGSNAMPTFVDIDGDGDQDAFVGKSDGITRYFRNGGTASAPAFAITSSNNFGLNNLGTFGAPAFVDIDADGDFDALVGNGAGATVFYRNTGTASTPAFAKQNTSLGLGNVGSYAAPAFADVDADGDFDAFIGGADGVTRFFRNSGSASAAAFTAEMDNFGAGDVGEHATPAMVDFDRDGRFDLVIGNAAGHLTFFHNDGSATLPAFNASPGGFGAADVAALAAPAFADLEHDGDVDLFVGSQDGKSAFQLNGGPAPLTFTPNRGTLAVTEGGATDAYTVVLDVQPTSNVVIRLVLDGQTTSPDSTLVFTPVNWNIAQQVAVVAVNDKVFEGQHTSHIQHTINSDDPIFGGAAPGPLAVTITDNDLLRGEPGFGAATSNPFGLANVGYLAHPTFVDIDGDGDLDAFIGHYGGTTTYFENSGSFSTPAFSPHIDNFGLAAVAGFAAPSFVDIDGDGDLDAWIGSGDGHLSFLRNTGTVSAPAFIGDSHAFGLTAVDGYATPAFADIDADGDPDAFVGAKSGDTRFFRNTGTASAPAFAAAILNNFGTVRVSNDGTPALADIDGDGDLDFLISNFFGDVQFFRNTGRVDLPGFVAEDVDLGLSVPGDRPASTFVDIDGDGDLDAFLGNNYGDTWFFLNTRSANSTPELGFLAPINYADTASLDNFAPISRTLAAIDVDGDTLVFGLQGGTDNLDTVSVAGDFGTLTVTKATGAYTFVPDHYAIEALGIAALDEFLVTASDGTRTTSRALTLNITQVGKTETVGNDKLVGTAGNNTFIPLGGTDTIDGGAGTDTVSFAWAASAVTLSLALLTTAQKTGGGTVSVKNVEDLIGTAFNDRLTGNAGANKLDGGAGKDTMVGAAGSDSYVVDNPGDVVTEVTSGGTDTVKSLLASYTLPANVENGAIGVATTANLTGNALANLLNGGLGVNKLTGGGGADRFDFNVLAESGSDALTRDTVADFSHLQGDLIDLSGFDANAGASGNQAFTKLTSSAAAFNPAKTFTAVGQLYFDQTAHELYANTVAGPAPEFSLKVLGAASLVPGDFIL